MTDRFKLIPAVFLILRRNNEVLLLRRANTGYQDGKYSVIAGHLDGDELGTHAIIREAKEEAGIVIDPKDLKFAHMVHRLNRGEPGQERIDIYYEASKWSGEVQNLEPHKCGDLTWYPADNLPPDTIPLVKHILQDVERGVHYSEYLTEPV